ncbi:MAG: hypothetical protein C0424_09585 [Sphingobacteriaceae bacterium]|nr:hypothetical protein [Sphingobacteriaceae bacterium]
MRSAIVYAFLLVVGLFLTSQVHAQLPFKGEKPIYECTDKGTVIHLPKNLRAAQLDSIISNFDLAELQLPHLYKSGSLHPEVSAMGWKLENAGSKYYKISKAADNEVLLPPHFVPGKPGEPLIPWEDRMLIADFSGISKFNPAHFYPTATWGINRFKRMSVIEEEAGLFTFILFGHEAAREVRLSGSFNGWSLSGDLMHKTARGWEIKVALAPGKHLYKFIIDGAWNADPSNEMRESDGFRGFNSVYFRNNKRFEFDALAQANKVYLLGNFNGWKDKEIEMRKVGGVWVVDMYLAEGTYAYRFKADKKYYLDPSNRISLTDGDGFENSYTSVGDTMYFRLNGFPQAAEVFVAGSFNQWNPRELRLQKKNGVWILPYVLGQGVYPYKFIVDGKWMVDPNASLFEGEPPVDNALMIVQSNHQFILKGYDFAEKVVVAGSFNGWNEQSLSMKRTENGWVLDYYVPPGKHTYKFKVDNEWILDPHNQLWEENEYHSGNSVLWKRP